jgi:hypothetical protein
MRNISKNFHSLPLALSACYDASVQSTTLLPRLPRTPQATIQTVFAKKSVYLEISLSFLSDGFLAQWFSEPSPSNGGTLVSHTA